MYEVGLLLSDVWSACAALKRGLAMFSSISCEGKATVTEDFKDLSDDMQVHGMHMECT